MAPDEQGLDADVGPRDALDLLDAGELPALAVDARDQEIRALNETLERMLDLGSDTVEGEDVHAIVAEKHQAFVEGMLEAIASGTTVGPTAISLRPPGAQQAQASLWVRVPRSPEGVGAPVVFLCNPVEAPVPEAPSDPLNPEGDQGFGRIPPRPGDWREQEG